LVQGRSQGASPGRKGRVFRLASLERPCSRNSATDRFKHLENTFYAALMRPLFNNHPTCRAITERRPSRYREATQGRDAGPPGRRVEGGRRRAAPGKNHGQRTRGRRTEHVHQVRRREQPRGGGGEALARQRQRQVNG
jgi:hypothetical protein